MLAAAAAADCRSLRLLALQRTLLPAFLLSTMSNPLDSGAIDRSGESANDDAGSDEPWPCALLMYSTAVEFLNAQQEQDEQARLYLRGCIHTLWECAGNATEDSFMHDVPSCAAAGVSAGPWS